jgi:hypothetical protein
MIEDVHFEGDQVPEVHLFVHYVDDAIDDREVVVGLLVLDPPHRGHFLVLFGCLCSLFPSLHLCFDFVSGYFQVIQIVNDVHMRQLIVYLVFVVQSICFQFAALLSQDVLGYFDAGEVNAVHMIDQSLIGVAGEERSH